MKPIVFLTRRCLVAMIFVLSACDSDPTRIVKTEDGSESVLTANPGYKLGPNDRVRIVVFGQPTLSGEFGVDGNGTLSYPLLGDILVGGMTRIELQQTITRRLEPNYMLDPKVSIEVVTPLPFYVIGEVQKPGNYAYVAKMTALNAVAMAGGFTYRARRNEFYVKRLDKDGQMIRLPADSATLLRPGDTLEVKERYF